MASPNIVFKRLRLDLSEASADDISGLIYLGVKINHIGSIEARLIKGGLHFVVHIDAAYQNQRLGGEVFEAVLTYFDRQGQRIHFIVGSWHRHEEFAHLPGGQSTNLTAYTEWLESGKSPAEAALSTPTGKWARKHGFDQVKLIKDEEDKVTVYFFARSSTTSLNEVVILRDA